MTDLALPRDVEELAEALAAASAQRRPVAVNGGGSRQTVGRPAPAEALALDLSAFAGVTDYEPTELVITAGAATPLASIEAELSRHNQMLAFDPPNHGPICGRPAAVPTIGGAVAANASGSRRLTQGAARDHVLGFSAVSGRGEGFKAGGRVVKNVTGFDLSKLMAGSWGTLAVLTELSVRVAPRPEAALTLLLGCEDPGSAVEAMARALGRPAPPTAAAFLPTRVADRAVAFPRPTGLILLRLEGPAASLRARADRLWTELDRPAAAETLMGAQEAALWKDVGEVRFLEDETTPLWRIVGPPAGAGSAFAEDPGSETLLDWAGGLMWRRSPQPPSRSPGVHVLRWGGGEPLEPALASSRAHADLLGQVRDAFDPQRILNGGRRFPPDLALGL